MCIINQGKSGEFQDELKNRLLISDMNDIKPVTGPKIQLKTLKDIVRPFTLLMPFVGFLAGAGIAFFYEKPDSFTTIPGISILLGCVAASILNAASNIINQIYDYEIDRINKPDRPLPGGRMTRKDAAKLGLGAYILAVLLAAFINMPVLIVVIITALITFFYSAPPIRFKKNPVLANVAMALPRGLLLPVVGWLAVRPDDPWNFTPWSIGLILFLYVVGAATTKDYADMKGDAAGGVRTLPVVLGIRRSAWVISPFFIVPFLLIPVFVEFKLIVHQALPLTFLAVYGVYIAWLILRNPDSLALEGNHPSWKHMYLLTMFSQLGFLASYILFGVSR
jgi:geranylgeranylglycerol-phosphate geranylgeranyltransferase